MNQNHSDLQTRAVQSLVLRAKEFRNFILASSGETWKSYQFSSSVAYGSWDLIKLFSDTPRIADEVRTMEGIVRYMSAHREAEFYCQVELWAALNDVLDVLAWRFSPVELYGSTKQVLASTIETLKLCTTTLAHNHVNFQYARLLLVHTARLFHETSATLTEANEALGKKLELARVPLTKAICALEKNTDAAAVTARENATATLLLLQTVFFAA